MSCAASWACTPCPSSLAALPLAVPWPAAAVAWWSLRPSQPSPEALVSCLPRALPVCSCVVVDFGSRNRKRGASRALWWGTEFIRYALTRTWLDRPAQAFLRGHSVAALFERQVQGFSKSTKKRLRYFKRVIPPGGLDEVRLVGAYAATAQDGCGTFYQQALWAGLLPGRQGQPGGEQGQAATAAARAEGEAAGLSQGDGAELVELSHEERERLLDGDCAVAVQRLLGLSLFLGGVSHAVLQRLDSSMDEDEQQQAGG